MDLIHELSSFIYESIGGTLYSGSVSDTTNLIVDFESILLTDGGSCTAGSLFQFEETKLSGKQLVVNFTRIIANLIEARPNLKQLTFVNDRLDKSSPGPMWYDVLVGLRTSIFEVPSQKEDVQIDDTTVGKDGQFATMMSSYIGRQSVCEYLMSKLPEILQHCTTFHSSLSVVLFQSAKSVSQFIRTARRGIWTETPIKVEFEKLFLNRHKAFECALSANMLQLDSEWYSHNLRDCVPFFLLKAAQKLPKRLMITNAGTDEHVTLKVLRDVLADSMSLELESIATLCLLSGAMTIPWKPCPTLRAGLDAYLQLRKSLLEDSRVIIEHVIECIQTLYLMMETVSSVYNDDDGVVTSANDSTAIDYLGKFYNVKEKRWKPQLLGKQRLLSAKTAYETYIRRALMDIKEFFADVITNNPSEVTFLETACDKIIALLKHGNTVGEAVTYVLPTADELESWKQYFTAKPDPFSIFVARNIQSDDEIAIEKEPQIRMEVENFLRDSAELIVTLQENVDKMKEKIVAMDAENREKANSDRKQDRIDIDYNLQAKGKLLLELADSQQRMRNLEICQTKHKLSIAGLNLIRSPAKRRNGIPSRAIVDPYEYVEAMPHTLPIRAVSEFLYWNIIDNPDIDPEKISERLTGNFTAITSAFQQQLRQRLLTEFDFTYSGLASCSVDAICCMAFWIKRWLSSDSNDTQGVENMLTPFMHSAHVQNLVQEELERIAVDKKTQVALFSNINAMVSGQLPDS
eukprot:TRINITY_DN795_c0_g1_i1.p1 TRINITY_DN795_c0_g1~~TRINITY_DN795_c0_g1_i1.p1  ORF type:complete len:746 (-),score=89.91 TRINITY_DN795_c0_g1_i1:788-3025(-)